MVLSFSFKSKTTANQKYYIDFLSSKPFIVTPQNTSNQSIKENPNKSLGLEKRNEKEKQQENLKQNRSQQIEDKDYLYKNASLKPSMIDEKSSILDEKNKDISDLKGDLQTQKETSGGGILTDEKFPYPWYITKLRSALWDSWQAKNVYSKNTSAVVKFLIYPNGEIKNVRIEKSSGNRLFDYSVLSAVTDIKKVDPLPADFFEDYLTVYVEFKSYE